MDEQDFIRCSRREARRANRRKAILDVAQSYFLQHGYAETSMSAISRTLGGSKGTLWAHYPSKEALFSAVADRASQSLFNEILHILSEKDEINLVLYNFTCHFLNTINSMDSISLNRLVIGEVNRFPEVGRIYYERMIEPAHTLLSDYLRVNMKRGLLRRADSVTAAWQLIGICTGGYHQQLVLGILKGLNPSHIHQEAEKAVETLLRAYAYLDGDADNADMRPRISGQPKELPD